MYEELTPEEEKFLSKKDDDDDAGLYRSTYSINFKKHPVDYGKYTKHETTLSQMYGDIAPLTAIKEKPTPKHTYHQMDTLAETATDRFSTGFMKNISEYRRNYYRYPNVETFVPKLNEEITKVIDDINDSTHMPKPQLVRAPYASMSLESMALETKKKLFEKYYSSVKTYYMEDPDYFQPKKLPENMYKTLEDAYYEKEKIDLKSPACRINTTDKIEGIARLFYKYHSDIKQISGLQAEIKRLLLKVEQKKHKLEVEKLDKEIKERIDENMKLKKQHRLRIPYRKDLGSTVYHPNEAVHEEAMANINYPLLLTSNNLVAEQTQRWKLMK